ncbi:peptidoglycan-binding protein [filamentous cyanobacterium LEGE 11480]|uniref:Peptidoglycan-binding protein n=1 Tax=Romeriopsis navalis LEGE 11480 TaxID=2777977 RepID=A0A928VP23_9CYAN|nr:cysteine peptidase family C39 domain-containing protein [Romeriopsis navalis]MBE9032158.1 peptidoglycan-binding protein [Romeriopsis navalis LEGE 11480]
MIWEIIVTILLGTLCWMLGLRIGRLMLRKGATANDLFAGNKVVVILVLALYLGLVALAVNLPQWQGLPLHWRVYGMQVSWTIIRVLLLGACGVGYAVCWKTARNQIGYLILVGALGLVCFTGVESYFLSPIHAQLSNTLRPNGVYRQSGNSSCAPAALATLFQRWHMPQVTESVAAKHAGTSRLGTSMPQVLQAVQELDMDGVELSPTWAQMRRINRPGILAVWQFAGGRKLPHAVALMAMTADSAVIADPARGKYIRVTRSEFDRMWRNEYLPIYRPEDDDLSPSKAREYLRKLGYETTSTIDAIRTFQTDLGMTATGKLDKQTILLLTGKFIKDAPTLDEQQFLQDVLARMNCADAPELCPW